MLELLPHQKPPEVDFHVWMMLGGVGTGLTTGLLEYIRNHMRGNPRAVVGLMTPTMADLHEHFEKLGQEFERADTTLTHFDGGTLYAFSDKTSFWAKGRQMSLLAVDRLNYCSRIGFERARANLRLKLATAGMKGTNLQGIVAIATQPLDENQIRRAERDWIREIADEEWTVVTRPDLNQMIGQVQTVLVCQICSLITGNLIRHEIEKHGAMARILKQHEEKCQETCHCDLPRYDAVYKTIRS